MCDRRHPRTPRCASRRNRLYIDIAAGIFSFQGTVYKFDATAPAAHCSGTPKVCTPLSSVTAAADGLDSAPVVANKFLYFAGDNLYAYGP